VDQKPRSDKKQAARTNRISRLRAAKAPQTFSVKSWSTRKTTSSRFEPASFAQKANSLSIKFCSPLPIAVEFPAFKTAN
jgi:hypothetical protein